MPDQLVYTDQDYLTFVVDEEEFGVDITSVKEIRVWSAVTKIPDTPDYLKGVINLRGVIVPIVDLRQRFNHVSKEYTETTVVVILQGIIRQKCTTVGIVVDAVCDVHKVKAGDVMEPPDLGSYIYSRFIKGMLVIDKKMIILLDSNKLLDVEELFYRSEVSV
jgi:purine-binding chemotaxis protein CheW